MAKRGFVALKVEYTKPIFFKFKDTFNDEFLVSEKRFKQLSRLARKNERGKAAKALELGKGARVKSVVRIPQSRLQTGFLSNLRTLR